MKRVQASSLNIYLGHVNTLKEAQDAFCQCSCNRKCGGITYEPCSRKYTLRRGKDLRDSPSKEISWLPCDEKDGDKDEDKDKKDKDKKKKDRKDKKKKDKKKKKKDKKKKDKKNKTTL